MARRFSAHLDLRMSAAQSEALDWWAAQVGCSVSELVRELLPKRIPRRSELADLAPEIKALQERLADPLHLEDEVA